MVPAGRSEAPLAGFGQPCPQPLTVLVPKEPHPNDFARADGLRDQRASQVGERSELRSKQTGRPLSSEEDPG